jgi:hypothetical protein
VVDTFVEDKFDEFVEMYPNAALQVEDESDSDNEWYDEEDELDIEDIVYEDQYFQNEIIEDEDLLEEDLLEMEEMDEKSLVDWAAFE